MKCDKHDIGMKNRKDNKGRYCPTCVGNDTKPLRTHGKRK